MTGLSEDARAAARGGTALLVLQTAARALGLLFVALVTRELGPSEFARYSVVASLVLMANFFADFGTTQVFVRNVSRAPAESDRLLSGTLPASLALGLCSYGLAMAFVALADYSHETVVDMAIGGLAILAMSVITSILAALDGHGLIARRAIITMLQTSVVAVGGAAAVLGGFGIRGAIVAIAAGPWVGLVVAVATARRRGVWRTLPRIDRAATGALLRAAVPFAIIGASSAFTTRFDVVLLSLVSSARETATFDLAQRLIEALTYVSAAITTPSLFILSRRIGLGDKEGAERAYGQAVRVLYLIGLPLSAGLAILADATVDVALGATYDGVATPFRILAAGQFLQFTVFIQMALVNSTDFIRRAIAPALAVAGITVAVDAVFIPLWDATGAAVALVASWVLAVGVYHVFVRRTVGLRTPLPRPAMLAAVAALAATAFPLRETPALAAVVGALAYGVVLVVSREVTRADIARLRSAIASRRAGP